MIWQDITPRVSLGLKITNWCNLCCAHCCERSHKKEPLNLMPIDMVRRYVTQYKEMGIPVWDYVAFTGGESMAPYFNGQEFYIPTVAAICAKNDLSPAFKTNAKWSAANANQILKDLSNIAHRYDRQISLDISIDEYHDNLLAAANVIDTIMSSQNLSAAIPVSFVGLNTPASQYKFQEFVNILRSRKIYVGAFNSPDSDFIVAKGNNINVMFYDVSGLTRLGRAADNNLTQNVPSGNTNGSDCLLITNDNNAILNYKYNMSIGNKTVAQIYKDLLQYKR